MNGWWRKRGRKIKNMSWYEEERSWTRRSKEGRRVKGEYFMAQKRIGHKKMQGMMERSGVGWGYKG